MQEKFALAIKEFVALIIKNPEAILLCSASPLASWVTIACCLKSSLYSIECQCGFVMSLYLAADM